MYKALVSFNLPGQALLIIFLFLGSLCLTSASFGQKSLSWKVLDDVTFQEKFDEEFQAYWLVPIFGEKVKAHENQTVVLEGYFIPIDMDGKVQILSRYPYANCFFCGGAGPESIVELQLERKLTEYLSMDDRVRFQGKLVLNESDYEHCNYILKDARLLK